VADGTNILILVSSIIFLSIGPLLIIVRFSPSEQFLSHDFRFAVTAKKAAVGKVGRDGKERDRTRHNQTKREERRRRRGRERGDRLSSI
jgi:hypothetical protein